MVGNVFWEHGHRMIAGSVGILTLILTLWIQFTKQCGRIKKLAWAAMGAVILQALLGGLTVLLMLPPVVSIFHACLAQTFFCLTVALAFFLRPDDTSAAPTSPPPPAPSLGGQASGEFACRIGRGIRKGGDSAWLFKLCVLAFSAAYLQLILGAIVRHTSRGIVFHVVWAFVVITLLFCSTRAVIMSAPERRGAVRAAMALSLLVIAQFFLGIGAFVYTQVLQRGYAPSNTEVIFASAHHTNGALVLGLSLLICLQVRK